MRAAHAILLAAAALALAACWTAPCAASRRTRYRQAGQNWRDYQRAPRRHRGQLPDDIMRIDYKDNSDSLYDKDQTTEREIETDVIPCPEDRKLCSMHKSCGKATLNKLRKGGSKRIWMGRDTNYGEWPFFARVQTTEFKECGGMILSDVHVLTSAQCVVERSKSGGNGVRILGPREINVTVGDWSLYDKDSHQERVATHHVCLAQGYQNVDDIYEMNFEQNDWAVLTLKKKLEFNDYVQPGCLPHHPVDRRRLESQCYAIGMGIIDQQASGMQLPYALQKLPIRRVSCRSRHYHDLDRSRECYHPASELGSTAEAQMCVGDLGDPILCQSNGRWTLVGTSSTARPCDYQGDDFGFVSVFTRMRLLVKDIQKQCGL